MKKIYTLFVALIISGSLMAQTPQSFNYQAVARDASGEVIADQKVSFQISILQSSESGTAVYVETHVDSTNQFGLVILEIGTGTTTDNFTAIDWGNDAYFIQVEMDAAGGTSYVLIGTSQLLSVPYALHAKTAKTVTGTITETDPVFNTSEAKNITTTDITNLSNLSGTNTGDQDISGLATTTSVTTGLALKVDKVTGKSLSTEDYTTAEQTKLAGLNNADGSETKVIAGTNITITGSGTIASPYVINATTTHTLGESYGGGIIFYVTPDGQHGLIAETQDQSTGCNWYEAQNTISNSANQSTAGKNYTDWRLPTKNELNLLCDQKTFVGGFADYGYWSSTEYGGGDVWIQVFPNGGQNHYNKYGLFYVRAVRAF